MRCVNHFWTVSTDKIKGFLKPPFRWGGDSDLVSCMKKPVKADIMAFAKDQMNMSNNCEEYYETKIDTL